MLIDVSYRALHIHGSLGASNELDLARMWACAPVQGLVGGGDGADKTTVALLVLQGYKPSPDIFPTYHVPKLVEAARRKYAKHLTPDMMQYLEGAQYAE